MCEGVKAADAAAKVQDIAKAGAAGKAQEADKAHDKGNALDALKRGGVDKFELNQDLAAAATNNYDNAPVQTAANALDVAAAGNEGTLQQIMQLLTALMEKLGAATANNQAPAAATPTAA